MEYISGETLTTRLQRSLTADSAKLIGQGVANAVAFIHARGLVHGDLHSDNVLVDDGGVPKVIDIFNDRSLQASRTGSHQSTESESDLDDLCFLLNKILEVAGCTASQLKSRFDASVTVLELRDEFLWLLDENGDQKTKTLGGEFLHDWIELKNILINLTNRSKVSRPQLFTAFLRELVKEKRIQKSTAREVNRIRNIRNQYVHGILSNPTSDDLNALRRLLKKIRI